MFPAEGKSNKKLDNIFSNDFLTQFIWFLAPTVTLCEQQHNVLRRNIPNVQIRLLIGSDNVHRWTEQRIWDIVLNNVRIVVSTHAVLADALSHGFVGMGRLALLVFDEGTGFDDEEIVYPN